MKKGCLVIILAVILVILLTLILLRWRMAEYGIQRLKERVVQSLPHDYARPRVDALFEEFQAALREKRIERRDAEETIKSIKEALKDKKLTREEVDQILDKLRKAIKR